VQDFYAIVPAAAPDSDEGEDMSIVNSVERMSIVSSVQGDVSVTDASMAQRPLGLGTDSLERIRHIWRLEDMSAVQSPNLHWTELNRLLKELQVSKFAENKHYAAAHDGNPPQIYISGSRSERERNLQLYISIPGEE